MVADATAETPIPQLTSRDLAILELALSYRGAVINDIHTRLWPSGSALSTCYRRIARLRAAGYLTAARVASFTGDGTGPLLFFPGPAAYMLLAQRLGLSSTTVRRIAGTRPRYIEHHLALNATRSSFERAGKDLGIDLMWIPEAALRRSPLRVPTPVGARAPGSAFVPDGGFILTHQGRRQHGFIEQDMDTIPSERLARRLSAYLRAVLPVFIIVPSERRAEVILQLAAQTSRSLSTDPTRIFVTTRDQITPDAVLTQPVWRQAGTDRSVVLFPSPHGAL